MSGVNEMVYIHERIVKYGTFIKDIEYNTNDDYHRVRIISLNGCLFYDHMCNGEVIECNRLLPIKEENK